MGAGRSRPPIPLLPVDRIVGLTDGMFAIIMTILVLTINVPDIASETASGDLVDALLDLRPTFFSYVLSFAILGFNWVGHHSVYYYIKHSDLLLIWLNFAYLLLLALIPFTTDLIGEYSDQRVAGVLYVGNVFIVSVLLSLQWWYAAASKRLIDKDLDPYLIREEYVYRLIGPIGFGIAFIASFFTVELAILIMIVTGFAHLFVRKAADWLTDRAEKKEAASEP